MGALLRLKELGHEVRLLPAQYVRAYVKRNKADAADAAALIEAGRIVTWPAGSARRHENTLQANAADEAALARRATRICECS